MLQMFSPHLHAPLRILTTKYHGWHTESYTKKPRYLPNSKPAVGDIFLVSSRLVRNEQFGWKQEKEDPIFYPMSQVSEGSLVS